MNNTMTDRVNAGAAIHGNHLLSNAQRNRIFAAGLLRDWTSFGIGWESLDDGSLRLYFRDEKSAVVK